jgi:hypothetical protein
MNDEKRCEEIELLSNLIDVYKPLLGNDRHGKIMNEIGKVDGEFYLKEEEIERLNTINTTLKQNIKNLNDQIEQEDEEIFIRTYLLDIFNAQSKFDKYEYTKPNLDEYVNKLKHRFNKKYIRPIKENEKGRKLAYRLFLSGDRFLESEEKELKILGEYYVKLNLKYHPDYKPIEQTSNEHVNKCISKNLFPSSFLSVLQKYIKLME